MLGFESLPRKSAATLMRWRKVFAGEKLLRRRRVRSGSVKALTDIDTEFGRKMDRCSG
jgi:hypothetical protein